jgi:RNA recognition motif-containing protein
MATTHCSSSPTQDLNEAKHQKISSQSKLFIGCLPQKISRKDIKDYFTRFGPISDIKLEIKKTTDSQSHLINACLHCSSVKMVEQIIAERPHSIKGCNLKVVPYMEQKELSAHIDSFRQRRLYMNHLPLLVSNDDLLQIFGRFGHIEKAYTVPEKKKKCNWKKGYVVFENKEALHLVPESGVFWKGVKINWHSYELKAKLREEKRKKKAGNRNKKRRSRGNREQKNIPKMWQNDLFNKNRASNKIRYFCHGKQGQMVECQESEIMGSFGRIGGLENKNRPNQSPSKQHGHGQTLQRGNTFMTRGELDSLRSIRDRVSSFAKHHWKPTRASYHAKGRAFCHDSSNLVLNRVTPLMNQVGGFTSGRARDLMRRC